MKNKKIHIRKVHIIAGPNGAGKTTFAKEFLPKYANCNEFVNVDLLAQGISPFAPDTVAVQAGRLMVKRIAELADRGAEFSFETTLAGKTYVNVIRKLKQQGYSIHLYFLWLPTVEMAIARVFARTQQGGHNVPEDVIRRRFTAGTLNLSRLFRPLVDELLLFDNSGEKPREVAWESKGQLKVYDKIVYNMVTGEL